MFKIYTDSPDNVKHLFINACEKYAQTSNQDYKNYWLDLIARTSNGEYTVSENYDFCGVRRIT